MKDLISVIVPIYNVSQYLKQCIDSIINQTYANLEIILIDDGSTDNCLEIMREYEKNDTRIKCYTRENKGLLYTRIDGVNKANGKYIIFVDSDDWLELNAIEILYNKITKYCADMVKCSYKMVNEKETIDVIMKENDTIFEKESLNKIYEELASNYIFHSVWSQLIKAEIIKKYIVNCDYSISMGEDIEINTHLLNKYSKIVITNDVLYNYRYNNSSISNSMAYDKTKKRVNDTIKAYNNLSSFIYENYKKEYKNALRKSIIEINNKVLDFANINNLKYKEINKLLKEIFENDFIDKIKLNTNYAYKKSIKNYMFLRNIYTKNYKLYAINLILLSKFRHIKKQKETKK